MRARRRGIAADDLKETLHKINYTSAFDKVDAKGGVAVKITWERDKSVRVKTTIFVKANYLKPI